MKIIAIIPKLFDYLVSSIIEGLNKIGIVVIASESGNNVEKIYSKKEIIHHSKSADYIFIMRGKVKGNIPPKFFLIDKINRPERSVFIDGSEWTYTGFPEKKQKIESLNDPRRRRGKKWINERMFNYCNWYFKRECYPEDYERGIIPLLFAAEDKNFINHQYEKIYDVFCSFGQNYSGLRSEVENVCKKLKSEGFNVAIKNRLEYEEYKKYISKSYITVDAWGGGDCTARFWEIIANKSCCFAQKYNIMFPNKFTDGLNYVEYTTIDEFETKLRYYLKDKEKCLEIAEKGYQHLLKYHTSDKRAKYLLEILEHNSKNKSLNHHKKHNVGKIFYIISILNSFIKDPRNIYRYLRHVYKEFKSRIK